MEVLQSAFFFPLSKREAQLIYSISYRCNEGEVNKNQPHLLLSVRIGHFKVRTFFSASRILRCFKLYLRNNNGSSFVLHLQRFVASKQQLLLLINYEEKKNAQCWSKGRKVVKNFTSLVSTHLQCHMKAVILSVHLRYSTCSIAINSCYKFLLWIEIKASYDIFYIESR